MKFNFFSTGLYEENLKKDLDVIKRWLMVVEVIE